MSSPSKGRLLLVVLNQFDGTGNRVGRKHVLYQRRIAALQHLPSVNSPRINPIVQSQYYYAVNNWGIRGLPPAERNTDHRGAR